MLAEVEMRDFIAIMRAYMKIVWYFGSLGMKGLFEVVLAVIDMKSK